MEAGAHLVRVKDQAQSALLLGQSNGRLSLGDNMTLGFYLSALTMMLVAFSFAASPLLRSENLRSAGFAQWPLLVVIASIGLAVALYAAIGKPDLASTATASETSTPTIIRSGSGSSPQPGDKADSVESLLGGLMQRLEENPDDGKGWLLLAKSYDHLGRQESAQDAYSKAEALGVTDAGLASKISGRPPGDPTSTSVAIRGTVTLASDVANLVGPTETIYITAKSANGSPMPVAVLRRSADDLPFDFLLDNSNSMVAGQALKRGEKVIVSAKISKSGDALLTSSALAAVTEPIDPGDDNPISLVIGAGSASAKNARQ